MVLLVRGGNWMLPQGHRFSSKCAPPNKRQTCARACGTDVLAACCAPLECSRRDDSNGQKNAPVRVSTDDTCPQKWEASLASGRQHGAAGARRQMEISRAKCAANQKHAQACAQTCVRTCAWARGQACAGYVPRPLDCSV